MLFSYYVVKTVPISVLLHDLVACINMLSNNIGNYMMIDNKRKNINVVIIIPEENMIQINEVRWRR